MQNKLCLLDGAKLDKRSKLSNQSVSYNDSASLDQADSDKGLALLILDQKVDYQTILLRKRELYPHSTIGSERSSWKKDDEIRYSDTVTSIALS